MLQSQAARVQKTFRQSSQTYDLIFEQLCVEPGVGLNDPYGSLPTQDSLWFCFFFLIHEEMERCERLCCLNGK